MRILLLANNIVGLKICQYLQKQNENIVGLCIHNEDKQRLTDEIIKASGIDPRNIFKADVLRDKKTLEKIKALKPDIAIAAFWGYILKPEFFLIPKLGTINFHPGYLPYNRGMNPNVWPIVENTPAGVTIHYIDKGIDTGDIIARKKVKVEPWDTADSVYEKTLVDIVKLFKEVWPSIKSKKNKKLRQERLKDNPTFHWAKDINSLDEISLNSLYIGKDLINRVRARSYKDRYYSYFIDKGRKVYLRLDLQKGEKINADKFEEKILNKISLLKSHAIPLRIPIKNDQKKVVGFLETFIASYVNDDNLIKQHAKWRKNAEIYFPAQFNVTFNGTKRWAKDRVILEKDRLLFLIRNSDNKVIGHAGLYRFDFKNKNCEIDNVLRGENAIPGMMTFAISTLSNWTIKEFKLKKLKLRVFADNKRAISLYKRCGFKKSGLITLRKEIDKNQTQWIEDKSIPLKKSERQYLIMVYAKK